MSAQHTPTDDDAYFFGAPLNVLARERGYWPQLALVFGVKVVGNPPSDAPPERVQIEITGGVPVGRRKDGRPKFGKRADDLRCFLSLAEYRQAIEARAAIAKAEGK